MYVYVIVNLAKLQRRRNPEIHARMNALEHQLDYVFADALPEAGNVMEASPGVFWVRMPLPFALDHINLWLMRDEIDGVRGWTIVDCGISDETIRANWERVFESHLDGLPVLRVIVTHCHPDHLGLADWICRGGDKKRWNARLWISLGEYAMGRVMAAGDGSNAGGERAARHFARHGLTDEASLEALKKRDSYYPTLVPSIPPQFRRLRNGDTLTIGGRAWEVVTGYGHSPEHSALFCAESNVLISGDMVLPRISTNVSVVDVEPEADPLTLYLDSIERMRAIDAGVLVLPSHGLPFKGLHTRIDQLQAHHAERFAETLEACAEAPQSAFELVPVLFKRPLDLHQMTFAMGESLAHLHALWFRGKLERLIGADGVIRFATV
jgi:glyoxylase-like metal-dependent hydrolase (beta-lactamase superfamily II)